MASALQPGSPFSLSLSDHSALSCEIVDNGEGFI